MKYWWTCFYSRQFFFHCLHISWIYSRVLWIGECHFLITSPFAMHTTLASPKLAMLISIFFNDRRIFISFHTFFANSFLFCREGIIYINVTSLFDDEGKRWKEKDVVLQILLPIKMSSVHYSMEKNAYWSGRIIITSGRIFRTFFILTWHFRLFLLFTPIRLVFFSLICYFLFFDSIFPFSSGFFFHSTFLSSLR